MKKIKRTTFLFFLIALAGLGSSILGANKAQAQIGQVPFGGFISESEYCVISNNVMITHTPAAGPPVVIYDPKISHLYAYASLFPDNWMLGNTLGMSACVQLIPFPPFVFLRGIFPLITIVGTSGAGMTADSGGDVGGSSLSVADFGGFDSGGVAPALYEPVEPCGEGDNTASSYIIANEGWRSSPYTDSLGHRTVGVGHRITGNEPFNVNQTLTNQQVAVLFEQDYNQAKEEAAMAAALHGVDFNSLSDTRQAVLTDMAFNMGGKGLAGFNNMWGEVARGNWNGAAGEIQNSTYASQLAGRSERNAEAMRTNDRSVLDRQISSDSQAWQFCQPSGVTPTIA